MALQQKHTAHGVTIDTAYFQIVRVALNRQRGDAHITLDVYTEKGQENAFDSILCVVPYAVETGDVIRWAYEQIKTLPAYADAIDV